MFYSIIYLLLDIIKTVHTDFENLITSKRFGSMHLDYTNYY